jgi:DNA-binding XRE family transcriptional regulator
MEKFKPNQESNFVKLRQSVGVTQKQVAEALKVTEQTVSNWENGRAIPKLTIAQIKTLCSLLGKSLEDIPDDFSATIQAN